MNLKYLLIRIFIVLSIMVLTFCGEPPEAETAGQSGEIVTEQTEIGIPVEAIIARSKQVSESIPFTGVILPRNSVDIIAEVSGKVEKIYKELGSYVSTKDTIAVIDDRIPLSNYIQSKSQLLSAENNLKIAELNLISDKELFEAGDISKLAFDNSELAVKSAEANKLAALANFRLMEKTYHDTRIMSPINGVISRKNVDPGAMVNIGMQVFRVVDLTTLKIELSVSQEIIKNVKVGDPAVIEVSALGNEKFNGVIKFISPQANENSGSFKVELHVKNSSDMKLLAGLTAKIELIVTNFDKQLVIPNHSLVTKNGDYYAYVVNNNIAKLTKLSVMKIFGSHAIIESGISEGDTVVVVGMKNLGVETKVRIEELVED